MYTKLQQWPIDGSNSDEAFFASISIVHGLRRSPKHLLPTIYTERLGYSLCFGVPSVWYPSPSHQYRRQLGWFVRHLRCPFAALNLSSGNRRGGGRTCLSEGAGRQYGANKTRWAAESSSPRSIFVRQTTRLCYIRSSEVMGIGTAPLMRCDAIVDALIVYRKYTAKNPH